MLCCKFVTFKTLSQIFTYNPKLSSTPKFNPSQHITLSNIFHHIIIKLTHHTKSIIYIKKNHIERDLYVIVEINFPFQGVYSVDSVQEKLEVEEKVDIAS